MVTHACALVLRFDYNTAVAVKPERRRDLEVVARAAEAILPPGAVLQPTRFEDNQHLQGVFTQPSYALIVLQTIQDAYPYLLFQVAPCGIYASPPVFVVVGLPLVAGKPGAAGGPVALNCRLRHEVRPWPRGQPGRDPHSGVLPREQND